MKLQLFKGSLFEPRFDFARAILLAIFVVLVASCSNNEQATTIPAADPRGSAALGERQVPARSLVAMNSLVVAPIRASTSIHDSSMGESFGNYDLNSIEQELVTALRGSANVEVAQFAGLKGGNDPGLKVAQDKQLAFVKAHNFDGMVVTELQSISNRSGSAVGTDRGAEFGVVVKVLDTVTGRVSWQGSYHEQDLPAQLVTVEGGKLRQPQFRSLESLVREGFKKIGADFAAARMKTYLLR